MIEESLKSRFIQVNFFLHNLAQLKFSSHSDGELLSFIPTTYSMATDGRIINIEIFDYQKRYHPEKHYVSVKTAAVAAYRSSPNTPPPVSYLLTFGAEIFIVDFLVRSY